MMPLLEFDRVGFDYGEGSLLNNISARIYENDCIALVGRNGIGKTTLLRLAAGILAPNSGDVRLKRSALRSLKRREMRDRSRLCRRMLKFHFPLPWNNLWRRDARRF
jgi:ABC-type cobalamin/Fe3+-siderophores transport system ATPase subunit